MKRRPGGRVGTKEYKMTRSVIKVSKKTLDMFKDARGINDPRRVSKLYEYTVSFDYFCKVFLPELKYCESTKEINWVCKQVMEEMFDNYNEDHLNLEIYYVETKGPNGAWDTLVWKCSQYSKEWKEVLYNTSSMFAAGLCELEEDKYNSD